MWSWLVFFQCPRGREYLNVRVANPKTTTLHANKKIIPMHQLYIYTYIPTVELYILILYCLGGGFKYFLFKYSSDGSKTPTRSCYICVFWTHHTVLNIPMQLLNLCWMGPHWWGKSTADGWRGTMGCVENYLGGGFKYFLRSPLFGEDSHFD